MENEENIGLINKKDSRDQWARLGHFSFGAFSLFSLSLILLDTQSFLGALWHWVKKYKEGKRKKRSSRERKDQAATIGFIVGINLHVYFPFQIWHAWDCMCFFSTMAWVFRVVTIFLAQPCHFLISLMRWVLSCVFLGMARLDSKQSRGESLN